MQVIQWDGAKGTLHLILETMRDCFIGTDEQEGVLYMKTDRFPEVPVPLGWYIIRSGEAQVTLSQEKPVE